MTTEKKRGPAIGLAVLEALLRERLHWSTFEQICEQGCHCVDGRCREQKGIAGVPGGDAGVLVAAVSAIEKITRQKISSDVIGEVMSRMPGTFYMHTDKTHGMHNMRKAILVSTCLSNYANTMDEAERLIKTGIPAGAQDREAERELERLVTRAEHQGCGHLKNMMTDPGVYHTRTEYVDAVLATAFRHTWRGETHAIIEPLEGDHNEGAVVQVEIDGGTDAVDTDTNIPLLQPGDEKGLQFYTLHPQVWNKRLATVGDLLTKTLGIPFDSAVLQREAEALLAYQTRVTAGKLTERQPFYVLRANAKAKTWTVERRGEVNKFLD